MTNKPVTLQALLLILFNLAYILPFVIYYSIVRNFEFLFYIMIMLCLIGIILYLHSKLNFSVLLLWGLSCWGLMHMAGGGLYINETKLYDTVLVPLWVTDEFTILKFDQFVHLYLYFIVPFLLYRVLQPCLVKDHGNAAIYIIVALAGIGIGVLNEIAEFTAVLAFADTGVGGYYNNAWDLVFNTAGALSGTICVYYFQRRKS